MFFFFIGIALYTLLTGAPLFKANRDDDLDGVDAVLRLKNWNYDNLDRILTAKIAGKDLRAADLLSHLLDPDPELRWTVSKGG